MKKIVTLFFLLIFLCTGINAQNADRSLGMAELKAQQQAYISERVELTPQEAEKFWPLYDEFRDKRMYLLREFRKEKRAFLELGTPTDKDYEKIVNGDLEVKLNEAKLTQEYYSLFEKILNPKQLYDFMLAEEDFTKEFLKRGANNNK